MSTIVPHKMWEHICKSIQSDDEYFGFNMGLPTCTNDNSSLSRPGPSQQKGQLKSGDNDIEAYTKLKQKIKAPGISVTHINIRGLVKNLSKVKILLQYTQIYLLALT